MPAVRSLSTSRNSSSSSPYEFRGSSRIENNEPPVQSSITRI